MKQILILILAAALLLCGCHAVENEVPPSRATQPTQPLPSDRTEPPQPDDVSADGQLMGKAETVEAAEETASLYGIALVRYNHGIAVYHTEEDPEEVIRRGEENGWPQLYLNRTVNLY